MGDNENSKVVKKAKSMSADSGMDCRKLRLDLVNLISFERLSKKKDSNLCVSW